MALRPRCFLAALALLTAACGINAIEPLPLDITLTADKLTTTPADSITFEVRAQGDNLLRIGVTWGDDSETSVLETAGARTARWEVRHAYDVSGVYAVSAAVDDAAGGRETASLSVTIQ